MNERRQEENLLTGLVSVAGLLLPGLVAMTMIPLLALVFGVVIDNMPGLMILTLLVTTILFKDVYRSDERRDLEFISHAARAVGPWLLVLGAIAILGYALKISATFSRRVLLTWALTTPLAIAAVQALFDRYLLARLERYGGYRTAIIAGVNEHSRRLGRALRRHRGMGIRLMGYFDDRSEARLGINDAKNLLGRLDDLTRYVRENGIEVVYIALPITHEQRMQQMLEELHDTTASIYFVPDIFVFDLIQSSVNMIDGIPVLGLRESPYIGLNKIIKRSSDIIIAGGLLVLTAPLLAAIAIAIKATTPGSAIFRQRRYGIDGQEITVYKFRTMHTSDDSDDVPQATRHDQRVTDLGRLLRRYSLDELPQLINVLQGRMSIVGPRPHAVAHNEMYRKLITGYMVRHKVPPGITGLAQVSGLRGETRTVDEMEARVAYDLEYLRSWSLALDLKIIAKTILTVFRDSRAY